MRVQLRVFVLGAMAVSGCGSPPQPPMAPAQVGYVEARAERVAEVVEFGGQIEAVRRVEVRSPVAGVIVAQPIREGSEVKAGDILFKIDPTQAEAAWRSAKARLAEAQARLSNATRTLARLRPLLTEHAVAQRDVDDADAAEAQARALVEDASAAVDRAKKDFDDTTIRAEISGRVGKANLVLGGRVTGPAELLTTIDALDPIRVSFRPSSQQLLSWRRDPLVVAALRPGGAARVRVVFPDGSISPSVGRLDFVDPVIDAGTGTQEFRAELPNPNRWMLPGQFVRVRLEGLVREHAILIPQRAVQQALGRQSVLVVGPGDTVRIKDVKASAWVGDRWLIDEGLTPGDKVIVDGIQKVRPGGVAKAVAVVASDTAAAKSGGGSR